MKLDNFKIFAGALASVALMMSGCAMCCGPYDYHYPTIGGSVQRSNPTWGRVGSLFSDPGPFGGPSADSNLQTRDMPSASRGIEQIEEQNSDLPLPENMRPDGGNQSDLPEPDSIENGVLPPPNLNNNRPSPDESTFIRRLRNQTQRVNSRWR
ncbi:MAG: hypothetical protein AAGA30_15750 [Planctomycetota bacterium]